jgi:hypothetical protein
VGPPNIPLATPQLGILSMGGGVLPQPGGLPLFPGGLPLAAIPKPATAHTVHGPNAHLPSAPNSRIYVGSINYDLTAPEIRDVFSPFGEIRMVQLMVRRISIKTIDNQKQQQKN